MKKNLYFAAGKILAYCIVHRGPKPSFFSPILYRIISEGIDHVNATVDDICDYEVRSRMQAVSHFWGNSVIK